MKLLALCILALLAPAAAGSPSIPRDWLRLFSRAELVAMQWLGERRVGPDQILVAAVIVEAAWSRGVPPREALIRGWAESNFRSDVIGKNARHRGRDRGAMQVNDKWHPEIARMTDSQRIHEGVKLLAAYNVRCGGDWRCTHQAYRTGKVRR